MRVLVENGCLLIDRTGCVVIVVVCSDCLKIDIKSFD